MGTILHCLGHSSRKRARMHLPALTDQRQCAMLNHFMERCGNIDLSITCRRSHTLACSCGNCLQQRSQYVSHAVLRHVCRNPLNFLTPQSGLESGICGIIIRNSFRMRGSAAALGISLPGKFLPWDGAADSCFRWRRCAGSATFLQLIADAGEIRKTTAARAPG